MVRSYLIILLLIVLVLWLIPAPRGRISAAETGESYLSAPSSCPSAKGNRTPR